MVHAVSEHLRAVWAGLRTGVSPLDIYCQEGLHLGIMTTGANPAQAMRDAAEAYIANPTPANAAAVVSTSQAYGMSKSMAEQRLADMTRQYIKKQPVKNRCTRCGGSGEYMDYGQCFRCGGSGEESEGKTAAEAEVTEQIRRLMEPEAKPSEQEIKSRFRHVLAPVPKGPKGSGFYHVDRPAVKPLCGGEGTTDDLAWGDSKSKAAREWITCPDCLRLRDEKLGVTKTATTLECQDCGGKLKTTGPFERRTCTSCGAVFKKDGPRVMRGRKTAATEIRTTPAPASFSDRKSQDRADKTTAAGGTPCMACGRPLNPAKTYDVHIIDGGNSVLHPDDEDKYVPDGGDIGHWDVGPECIKALPPEFRGGRTKTASMEVLGTYYHGTYEDLPNGTVLLPGSSTGRRNFGTGHGASNDHVYVTPDIDSAGTWGQEAAKNKRRRNYHVYEVAPHQTPVQGNPTHDEWKTPGATVVRKIFTERVR